MVSYSTEERNKGITVKTKDGRYHDTLTGYWYEDGGRKYYGTIEHGFIERSHFKYQAWIPQPSLSDQSIEVLRQLKRTFA